MKKDIIRRMKSQIEWLHRQKWNRSPVSQRAAEIVARRIAKNLHSAEAKSLRREIILHLTGGELSVEAELAAAIRNFEIAAAYRRQNKKKGGEK